ncbi:MAG: hypothetical protein U1D30_06760 [Planctomycetota bacterium]
MLSVRLPFTFFTFFSMKNFREDAILGCSTDHWGIAVRHSLREGSRRLVITVLMDDDDGQRDVLVMSPDVFVRLTADLLSAVRILQHHLRGVPRFGGARLEMTIEDSHDEYRLHVDHPVDSDEAKNCRVRLFEFADDPAKDAPALVLADEDICSFGMAAERIIGNLLGYLEAHAESREAEARS